MPCFSVRALRLFAGTVSLLASLAHAGDTDGLETFRDTGLSRNSPEAREAANLYNMVRLSAALEWRDNLCRFSRQDHDALHLSAGNIQRLALSQLSIGQVETLRRQGAAFESARAQYRAYTATCSVDNLYAGVKLLDQTAGVASAP